MVLNGVNSFRSSSYIDSDDESQSSTVSTNQNETFSTYSIQNKQGVVVLDVNQKLVGNPGLMSLDRVEQVREEALSLAQTVMLFENMSSMQAFLDSRKVHVLVRVDGVLQSERLLLSPEYIDNFIMGNVEALRFSSEEELIQYQNNNV